MLGVSASRALLFLPLGIGSQPSSNTQGYPLGPFPQNQSPGKPSTGNPFPANPWLLLCPPDLHGPLLFLIQLWVTERLPMASSMEHGKDLPSVQLLMKKNQVRQNLKAKEGVPRASPDLNVCLFGCPGVLGAALSCSM